MLKEVEYIDASFYSKEGTFPGFITIYVEGGEWEDARALDWLDQKIKSYMSALALGGELTVGKYKNCKFTSIGLFSRHPIPPEAQKFLYKKKKELAESKIALSYSYSPKIWRSLKKDQTITRR